MLSLIDAAPPAGNRSRRGFDLAPSGIGPAGQSPPSVHVIFPNICYMLIIRNSFATIRHPD